MYPPTTVLIKIKWCPLSDSNGPPTDYKTVTLPDELRRHTKTESCGLTRAYSIMYPMSFQLLWPYTAVTFSHMTINVLDILQEFDIMERIFGVEPN